MLGVSKTAYYEWCGRPKTQREEANELLTEFIKNFLVNNGMAAEPERLKRLYRVKVID
jgi:hypothetical protein